MDPISGLAKVSKLFVAATKLAGGNSIAASIDAFAEVMTSSRELVRFIDEANLTRLADEVNTAINVVGQHLGTAASDAKKIFLQAVPEVIPTPSEIVASGLDVNRLCELMVEKMEASSVAFDFHRTPMSRSYVRAVGSAAFERLLKDESFISALEPEIYRENFAQHRKTQEFIAKLLWRLEVTQKPEGQLSRAVIRMAQQIAEDVEDVPTAMGELGGAIATLRLMQNSEGNDEFGSGVDAALSTAATQSVQGEHEAALETIEAELTKIEHGSFVAATRLVLAARREAYLLRDPVLLGQWGTRLVRLFQGQLLNDGIVMEAHQLVPYAETHAIDLLAEGLATHFTGRVVAATSAAESAFCLLMASRCLFAFAGCDEAPTSVLEKLTAGAVQIAGDKAWSYKGLISEGSVFTFIFRVTSRLALRREDAGEVNYVSESVIAYLQANANKLEKHEFAQICLIMADLLTWQSRHHQDPVYLTTAIKSLQASAVGVDDPRFRNSVDVAMGELVVEELRMTGSSGMSVKLAKTLFDRRSKIVNWNDESVLSWIDVLVNLRDNDSAVGEVIGDEDYLALLRQAQEFSQLAGVVNEKYFYRQLSLAAHLTDIAETQVQFSEPLEILDALSDLTWLVDSPGHEASLLGTKGLVLMNLAAIAADPKTAQESVAHLERATRMLAQQGNTEAGEIYAYHIENAKNLVEEIQSDRAGLAATKI